MLGAMIKMTIKHDIIHIDSSLCFKCGKPFGTEKGIRKTKHHAIPRTLRPERNITLPMHERCHLELNRLYTTQQKKRLAPKSMKVFSNRMEGLVGSSKSFMKKIKKVYDDFMSEIARIEGEKIKKELEGK